MHSDHRQLRDFPLVPALFILPLALDFKSNEAGGSPWQYLLFALTATAFVLFVSTKPTPKARGGFWKMCSNIMLLVLGGSVVSLLVNGTPFDKYARVILPIALFWAGYLVSLSMSWRGQHDILVRLLTIGCAVSVVFSVPAGFLLTGADTSEVRYQILSPVLLSFEAVLLHRVFIVKRGRRMSWLWLVACLALQLLSVTRSSLLAFAFLFVGALWLSSPTVSGFTLRTLRRTVPVLIIGVTAYSVTTLIAQDVADRWQARILAAGESGADPTTLSRLAEMKEQVDRWSSTPASVLVGQGYGATYTWSKDFFDAMLDTKAWRLETIDLERFEFGHSFWVSSLFCGGLLFGTALPFLLLYATYTGTRTARRFLRGRHSSQAYERLSLSVLLFFAALGSTIGSNPFGYRYSALVAGLALGILVVNRRVEEEHDRAVSPTYRTPSNGPTRAQLAVG